MMVMYKFRGIKDLVIDGLAAVNDKVQGLVRVEDGGGALASSLLHVQKRMDG